jgi:hypothetical protein
MNRAAFHGISQISAVLAAKSLEKQAHLHDITDKAPGRGPSVYLIGGFDG